jgi:UPF0271 protein
MLIDLNADLGEGAGTDAALMPLITSANVSCGFHAGDSETVAAALELAKRHGVRVGAHPGYPDREHFGRREMTIPGQDLLGLLNRQLHRLSELACEQGLEVRYVKPHGALYNQACRDERVAGPVVLACKSFERSMTTLGVAVVGLPGSELDRLTAEVGLAFIPEGFADRRYRPDGSLVPRTEPDALLHDPKEVVEQVEWLVREKGVRTICVHGDTPGAVEFVRAVRAALLDAGHELKAFC